DSPFRHDRSSHGAHGVPALSPAAELPRLRPLKGHPSGRLHAHPGICRVDHRGRRALVLWMRMLGFLAGAENGDKECMTVTVIARRSPQRPTKQSITDV